MNSHVCKRTRSDVSDVLLRARPCECESWLFPPEFPENPDSAHLIATHHVVTLGVGTVHAVLPQLSFPFTLPCSALLRTFFSCSICTFTAFYWSSSSRGCFFVLFFPTATHR